MFEGRATSRDRGAEPSATEHRSSSHAGRTPAVASGQYAGTSAALLRQRAAINREVAATLRKPASGRSLARCAGRCACGGRCQDEEVLAQGARKLSQAAIARVASRRTLQRTPARKVSCAPGPLNVPGLPALTIDDPVAVITAAEDRANELIDAAISELDFTIQQIAGGAPIGFPTVSDSLGAALRLLALDPDDPAVWSGRGIGSARLLLRRLRLIRGTIGSGSFFFTCIGPATGSIGHCAGTICGADGQAAVAASCDGAFRIVFCEQFWRDNSEDQAARIVHESSHNFAEFVQDAGREGNAECYARFVGVAGGAGDGYGRPDLCADPP